MTAESSIIESASTAQVAIEEKRKTAEAFYDDFWRKGDWADAAPNSDEIERADAISKALVTYLSSGRQAPLRILDVGCGRGWLSQLLSAHGQVMGIDPTEAGVRRARELFPALRFEAWTTDQVLEHEGANSFDLVVCSEVVEHVPQPAHEPFLATFFELLRPRGVAILTTPRGELLDFCRSIGGAQQPIEDWLTEQELMALGLKVGLRMRLQRRVFVPGYRYDFLSRLVGGRKYDRLTRLPMVGQLLKRIRHGFGVYQLAVFEKPDKA